jgi:hypothetical protein
VRGAGALGLANRKRLSLLFLKEKALLSHK